MKSLVLAVSVRRPSARRLGPGCRAEHDDHALRAPLARRRQDHLDSHGRRRDRGLSARRHPGRPRRLPQHRRLLHAARQPRARRDEGHRSRARQQGSLRVPLGDRPRGRRGAQGRGLHAVAALRLHLGSHRARLRAGDHGLEPLLLRGPRGRPGHSGSTDEARASASSSTGRSTTSATRRTTAGRSPTWRRAPSAASRGSCPASVGSRSRTWWRARTRSGRRS